MTPLEQFQERVLTLQTMLTTAHPNMPILLREIHNGLKADPEIVTLMTEEEIAIVVSGLSKQTQVQILAAVAKKGTGKALKKVTVMDL